VTGDATPGSPQPDGTEHKVRRRQTVEHAWVVVRACQNCGGKRDITDHAAPCPECGTTDPAIVDDLGILDAHYRNPLKRLRWTLIGRPKAWIRIGAANGRQATRS
jgi:hypothetical protein